MKYLLVAILVSISTSAFAVLTPEQEISKKCALKMAQQAKYVQGKSILTDKRTCECVTTSLKKAAKPEQLQDVADFFTEKYDAHNDKPESRLIQKTVGICVTKLFTKEERDQERKNQQAGAAIAKKKRDAEKAAAAAKAKAAVKPAPAKTVTKKQ